MRGIAISYTFYAFGLGTESSYRKHTKIDVIAAFDYYINNFNGGRPFFVAGHSLGSNLLLYFPNICLSIPTFYARLNAAYVIGYSVTSDYITANPHLKFAEKRYDTGVIYRIILKQVILPRHPFSTKVVQK